MTGEVVFDRFLIEEPEHQRLGTDRVRLGEPPGRSDLVPLRELNVLDGRWDSGFLSEPEELVRRQQPIPQPITPAGGDGPRSRLEPGPELRARGRTGRRPV